MNDPYSILGVSREATDDEIKEAYRALARKYHPDNYDDDNPLKDLANEKMQQINAAYDTIQKERSGKGEQAYKGSGTYYESYAGSGSSTGVYADVRRMINARRFGDAERTLLSIPAAEQTAEWHYLISIVLVKRGRYNDAMRELEIACSMEPDNLEYQKAKEMFNTGARGYGSTYYGGAGQPSRSQDVCCDTCANLVCLDCMCECCGGELIPCI